MPVLFSFVAEPLTGLADTAFVKELGAAPLAGLGVGTIVLSSLFWIFNFLGIGTQTEVAHSLGAGDRPRARQFCGLALALAAAIGLGLVALGLPLTDFAVRQMGGEGEIRAAAVAYVRVRWFGAPAVLLTLTAFGALRGLQNVSTPLWITVAVNALNVALDALLIFGWGPVPALGVTGAAWATVASQWIGAGLALRAVRRALGFPAGFRWRDAVGLFVVGRDLFLRTGLLTFFLVLTTRAATRMGADPGAAHQAIRQFWAFTAFVLDAFGIVAQSLVGYFLGAGSLVLARRAAGIACAWGLAAGTAIAALMLVATAWMAELLVPQSAWPLFAAAWVPAALAQPLNALAFATDGIHWGTRDYRFLRNAMLAATGSMAVVLQFLDTGSPDALTSLWVLTGVWISLRAALGVLRIWPGIGHAPLRVSRNFEESEPKPPVGSSAEAP